MDTLISINSAINNFVWGIPAMVCILGIGLYLSIRTGFIQIRKFGLAMKETFGKIFTKGEKKDYAEDIENRFRNGEMTNSDSIHFADSLKFYTLRKHRVVYGGGGIMPDYFVPLDTVKYTKYHRQLSAKSHIINANLKYIDDNRKALKKKYSTFEDFYNNFEVPQSLIDGIFEKGAADDIKPKDDEELARTIPYLRTQLKALIARDLWDMNEYFHVFNETNDIVLKGIEILQQ